MLFRSHLRVPRRLTAVLGGESLVNDATGLVGVQIGVVVTLEGAFRAGEVALQFAWVAGFGVLIGIGRDQADFEAIRDEVLGLRWT